MEMSQRQQTPGMVSTMSMSASVESPFLYRPVAGVWDEMIDEQGAVRPHWQKFHAMLQEMGPQVMQSQASSVIRMLRDHGVTYNAYQDTGAAGRPWFLDVMPMLLSPQDFSQIEIGLQQRMRLYRAIVSDVYGPQRMIKEGWIPPRLLYANPGYLRQVRDISVPEGMLFAMSTDLIRDNRGVWTALADRCQMPSGVGYSLENRIVMSRVLPREFKDCKVQRLASFFERERTMFRDLAPANRHTPTVVMVTPGPHHRNYFEHAFKARYLGFPLVEGADLTVRDTRLFLKTLEGLRQVDVLVRRVEDRACDSLELDADAWTGVPGLLESWCGGKVSIANGVGTGLLEAPAWLPFLPGLCRHLLGEELLINAVPTWWCGQAKECATVLQNPRQWVFKRAFCDADRPAQAAAALSEADLAKLLAEVRLQPEQWVAQQMQTLSSAPMWTGNALAPRSFVLRTFTCGDNQGCHVMPGGLGRVSPEPAGFLVTMNAGALSKDVWVLSDSEVEQKTLLGAQLEVLRVARPASEVPSRIADHLFWLGRYAERMEQTTRVLRMLCSRLGGEGSEEQWREMMVGLRLAKDVQLFEGFTDVAGKYQSVQLEIQELLENPKREGGVPDLLGRLRFNAAAARDRLSDDTWRLFNRLMEEASQQHRVHSISDMMAKLDRIILDMAAFSGMQSENMVQGHGWRFLEIGRRIERGMASAKFNQAAIKISLDDDVVLGPMLEIFDSTMTYRRHHYARPKLLFVLDLLLFNAANPRSLAYQLDAMKAQVALLPQGSSVGGEVKAQEEVEAMRTALHWVDLKSMEAGAESAVVLGNLCESLFDQLESFSNHLTEDYFSLTKRRSR